MKDELINWIFEQHESTNHMYSGYLPYKFHLNMVDTQLDKYLYLVPTTNLFKDMPNKNFHFILKYAGLGHDLIEDTRVSYNDVKKVLGFEVAEIIYALTNLRGRNRAERASDEYYKLITETPGATLIKLCDRISNVKYSMLTNSRMFDLYKNENENFIKKLNIVEGSYLYEACKTASDDLNKLFFQTTL